MTADVEARLTAIEEQADRIDAKLFDLGTAVRAGAAGVLAGTSPEGSLFNQLTRLNSSQRSLVATVVDCLIEGDLAGITRHTADYYAEVEGMSRNDA